MVHKFKACVECKRNCSLYHDRRKYPKPLVSSFFKVLFGDGFSNVLLIPPKFAPTVSPLIDQKVVLEDSNGQKWKVKLTTLEDSFALHQGWDIFSSDHGLAIGDFVILHYIMGSHFVVQIYGPTGCEKLDFPKDRTLKKTAESDRKTTVKGRSCHKTVKDYKEGSSSSFVSASNVETSQCQVEINDVSDRIGRIESVSEEEFVEEPCKNMINRKEKGKVEFPTSSLAKLTKNLATVDGSKKIVGGRKSSHHVDKSRKCRKETGFGIGIKGTLDNKVPLVASTSSSLPKKKAQPREKLEVIEVEDDDQINKPKIVKEEQVLAQQQELAECHAEVDEVLKLRTLPTVASISRLMPANKQSFLELPAALTLHYNKRRTVKDRKVVLLRDPDTRLWPVLYHETSQFNILTSGWETFRKSNNIQPGDACTFNMECGIEGIFSVSIVPKTR